MKVPSRITVQGRNIPIRYLKQVDPKDDCYGEYDDEKKEILISKTMHKGGQELFGTVFHEICHAIMDMTGQNSNMSGAREEILVRAFENSLYQLIQFRVDTPMIKWREVKFPFESGETDEESE